jgi:hypothetical protein
MSSRLQALNDLARCLRRAQSTGAAGPSASLEWMLVLEIANEQLLTPALWSALHNSGGAALLPADARDYLAALHRLNGKRNDALRTQAVQLIGALNKTGIAPVLLKGGLALFDGPYADPAARMMRDLDVLVPAGLRENAIAVLQQLGYRLVRRYAPGHHAFGDFARPNDPGSVDLHTELVDPSYVLPAAEVWARVTLKEVGGVRYLSPDATDRVMHNLLHAQIHFLGNFYRGELQLQQVHELVALAHHFGPAVDWRFVEKRMRDHRLMTPLESYLLAAHRLLGLDWPLAAPPSLAARLHYGRCELLVAAQALKWTGVVWGNLRGAFAWHRMRALYGSAGGPLGWRSRHLLQYVRKRGVGASVTRLRRVD